MRKFAEKFNNIMMRFFPDAFVIAIVLLLIVVVSALIFTPTTPIQLLEIFGSGIWGLLGFSMQLVFVIVTASAIANYPPIKRFITKLARIPKTPVQAVIAVVIVGASVSLLNWGVGLVIAAFYAIEVAKNVKGSHYPLLIAAGYAGYQIWGSGISSSIPLTVNTPGHAMEQFTGLIRFSETVFSPYNLIITIAQIATIAIVLWLITPKSEDAVGISQEAVLSGEIIEEPYPPIEQRTFSWKLENNRVFSLIAGIICLAFFGLNFSRGGINSLNLNSINLLTLGIGLCLYKGLGPYLRVVKTSGQSVVSIIILYPFYSAISTMIIETGLGGHVTQWFASFSTRTNAPIVTYLASGLINIFIPAAGGQWMVQAPIFMPLSDMLGINKGLMSMAITYGDTWTNLLQPFWALPLLAIAKLRIQDIVGYTILVCIVIGIVTAGLLYFLPMLLGI